MRERGFREAMQAAGRDAGLVVEVSGAGSAAAAAATRNLLADQEPPTAVFVATDNMALGVLEACAGLGVDVPTQLAVVGFDNVWVSRLPGVSLTSVDGMARHLGQAAAHQLTQRIARTPEERAAVAYEPELVVLRPELVVRRSCGCSEEPKSEPSLSWPDRKPVSYPAGLPVGPHLLIEPVVSVSTVCISKGSSDEHRSTSRRRTR